jgi:hypothetical protein
VDHHTREALGRICRWALLGVLGLASLGLLQTMAKAFLPSLAVAQGWTVTYDSVASPADIYLMGVLCQPAPINGIPAFCVRSPDGIVRHSITWGGSTYVPGMGVSFSYRVCPMPYSGYVVANDTSRVFVYPKFTRVLVVDTDALLAIQADGSLSPTASQDWPQTAKDVPLRSLGTLCKVVYLVDTPLEDYSAARAILRRAPSGAVLPASRNYVRAADDDDVFRLLRQVESRFKTPAMLVTERPVLAEMAKTHSLPYALVQADLRRRAFYWSLVLVDLANRPAATAPSQPAQ